MHFSAANTGLSRRLRPRKEFLGEQPLQLRFDRRLHKPGLATRDGQTVKHQPLYVQIDVHAKTCSSISKSSAGSVHRKSASLTGRSSLSNSLLTASSTNRIVTFEPSAAARNAAFNAAL